MNIFEYQENARKKLVDMFGTNLISKDEANEFTKRVHDAESKADIDAILEEARNLHSRINKAEIEHETRELYKSLRQDIEVDDDAFVRTRDGELDASVYDEVLGSSDEEEEQEEDSSEDTPVVIEDEEPEQKEKKKKKKSKKTTPHKEQNDNAPTDNTNPYGQVEPVASSTSRFQKNHQEAEMAVEDAAKKAAKDAEYANRQLPIEDTSTVPPRSEYHESEVAPVVKHEEQAKAPIAPNAQDEQITPTVESNVQNPHIAPSNVPEAQIAPTHVQEPVPAGVHVDNATQINTPIDTPNAEEHKAEPYIPAESKTEIPASITPNYQYGNQQEENRKYETPTVTPTESTGYPTPDAEPTKGGEAPILPTPNAPNYQHAAEPTRNSTVQDVPVAESRTEDKGYTPREVQPERPVMSQGSFAAPVSGNNDVAPTGTPHSVIRDVRPSEPGVAPVKGVEMPAGVGGSNAFPYVPAAYENSDLESVVAARIAAKANAMYAPVINDNPLVGAIPTAGYSSYYPAMSKSAEGTPSGYHGITEAEEKAANTPIPKITPAEELKPAVPGFTPPTKQDTPIQTPAIDAETRSHLFQTARMAAQETAAQAAAAMPESRHDEILQHAHTSPTVPPEVHHEDIKPSIQSNIETARFTHQAYRQEEAELISKAIGSDSEYHAALQTARVEVQTAKETLDTFRAESRRIEADIHATEVQLHADRSELTVAKKEMMAQADTVQSMAHSVTMAEQAVLETRSRMERATGAEYKTAEAAYNSAVADLTSKKVSYERLQAEHQTAVEKVQSLTHSVQAGTTKMEQLKSAQSQAQADVSYAVAVHSVKNSSVQQLEAHGADIAHNYTKNGTTIKPEAMKEILASVKAAEAAQMQAITQPNVENTEIFARAKANTETYRTQHLEEIRKTAQLEESSVLATKTHPATTTPGYQNTINGRAIPTVFTDPEVVHVSNSSAASILASAAGHATASGAKQDVVVATADDGTKYAIHSNGFIEPVVMHEYKTTFNEGLRNATYHTIADVPTSNRTAVVLADGTHLSAPVKVGNSEYKISTDVVGNKYALTEAGVYRRIDDKGTFVGNTIAVDKPATTILYKTQSAVTENTRPVSVILTDGVQLNVQPKTTDAPGRIATDTAGNKYQLTETGSYQRVNDKGELVGKAVTVDVSATRAMYNASKENAAVFTPIPEKEGMVADKYGREYTALPNGTYQRIVEGKSIGAPVSAADVAKSTAPRIVYDTAGNQYRAVGNGEYQPLDAKGNAIGAPVMAPIAQDRAAKTIVLPDGTHLNAPVATGSQMIATDKAGNKYTEVSAGVYQRIDDKGTPIGKVMPATANITSVNLPNGAKLALTEAAQTPRMGVANDGTKLLFTPVVATGSNIPNQRQVMAIDEAGNKYTMLSTGEYQRVDSKGEFVGKPIRVTEIVNTITLPDGSRISVPGTTPKTMPTEKAPVGAGQFNTDKQTGATSGVAPHKAQMPETAAKTGMPNTKSAAFVAATAAMGKADVTSVANTVIQGNKVFVTNEEGRMVTIPLKKWQGMNEAQRTEHTAQAFAKQAGKPTNTASVRMNPDVEVIRVGNVDVRVKKSDWAKMSPEQRKAYLQEVTKNNGFSEADFSKGATKATKTQTTQAGKFKEEFGSVRTFYSQKLARAASRLANTTGRQPMMILGNLFRQTDFAAGTHEMGKYVGAAGMILVAPGIRMLAKDVTRTVMMQNNLLTQVRNGAVLSETMSRADFMRIDAEANGFTFKPKKSLATALTRKQLETVQAVRQLADVEKFLLKHQNAIGKETTKMLRNGQFFQISGLKDIQSIRSAVVRALTASGGIIPQNLGILSIDDLRKLLSSGKLSAEQAAAVKYLITLDKQGKAFQQHRRAIHSRRMRLTMIARGILMQTDAGRGLNSMIMVAKTARMVGKAGFAAGKFGAKLTYRNIKNVAAVRDKMRLAGLNKAKRTGDVTKLEKLEAKIKKTAAHRQKATNLKDKINKGKANLKDKAGIGRRVKESVKKKFANSALGKAASKISNSFLGKAVAAPFKAIASASAFVAKVAAYCAAGIGYFLLAYIVALVLLATLGEAAQYIATMFCTDNSQAVVATAVDRINELEDEFTAMIKWYETDAVPLTQDSNGNAIVDWEGNTFTEFKYVDTSYWNYAFTQLSLDQQRAARKNGDARYASTLKNGRFIMAYSAVYFLQDFDNLKTNVMKDYSEAIWKASHGFRAVQSEIQPCLDRNCKATYFRCSDTVTATIEQRRCSSETITMLNDFQSRYYNTGGCCYYYHSSPTSTRHCDMHNGNITDTNETAKYIYVGSSSYRGAKAGSVYYSQDSSGNKIGLPVNPSCGDYNIKYCSNLNSCSSKVTVTRTDTYYQCGGHTDANGNKTYHGSTITMWDQTFEHMSKTPCDNYANTYSFDTNISACRGHFSCVTHNYCPGTHVFEYCAGHVNLDIYVVVFSFDDLFTLCKSLTNDNLGLTSGPVPNIQNTGAWMNWQGLAYDGTTHINFQTDFWSKLFPGGVVKQRDKFVNEIGWTNEAKEWAWSIADQNWEDLYGVKFKGEYWGTPLKNAEIRQLMQDNIDNPTRKQQTLFQKSLSLVGKVKYFWGGGHDRLVKGWDDQWGAYRMVTAAGSENFRVGTWHSYGLDCSGYVRWVYYNTYGIDIYDYISGLDDFMDPNNPKINGQPAFIEVPLSEARMGDIVVQYDYGHTGIFLDYEAGKHFMIVHSTNAGAADGVTISYDLGNKNTFKHIYRLNFEAFGIEP